MKRDASMLRRHLDARFAKVRPLGLFASKPATGWIRTIRQALGMNAAQLAGRMGVSQPRIIALEKSEAAGAVNLKTLQRAADALDCNLYYVLVPKEPLEHVVHVRAQSVAAERLANVEHTMRLENQPTSPESQDRDLQEVAETLVTQSPQLLWNRR